MALRFAWPRRDGTLGFTCSKALLPLNLMVIYPKWQIDAGHWVSYVPGALLVGCFLVFWWKRRAWGRPLLFGLGYFVVMLFPVLGLLKQGPNRLMFIADRWDHWQYYSIVGVIALVVAAGELVWRRLGVRSRWGTVVAGVAVLMALGVGTWRRNCVYRDDETLWKDNVLKNPNTWVGHDNLGDVLRQAGRLDEAMAQYEQAILLKPDFAEAHNNLGGVLLRMGKPHEAIVQDEQAIRIQPDLDGAHVNLGNALFQLGEMHEAISQYEEALRIRPDLPEAHYNLGNALLKEGEVQKAIEQYRLALKFRPDWVAARNALAQAQVM